MKKWVVFCLLLAFPIYFVVANTPPKREVRAVWLTTLDGLDWPRTRARTSEGVAAQQKALCNLLDQLQRIHINTVLLQTRVRGDVIYPSAIEPFHYAFSGIEGVAPSYDPLDFVVKECHKRGMECHAWLVTIPMGKRTIRTSPYNKCVVRYKDKYYLNPAHSLTKEYLAHIAQEIVHKYDVDGIHLDYIRYPEHAPDFDRRGKKILSTKEEEERRKNITSIVKYIYQSVKQEKPWVKVSSSPIGKLRDTGRYSSNGWNAMNTVGQDVLEWLKEGIMDMIFPMMYFEGNSFYPFALDWQENGYDKQIVPGLGIYFLAPPQLKREVTEIKRQCYFIRNHHLAGMAMFRTQHLLENAQGIYDFLKDDFYVYPALQPLMVKGRSLAAPASATVKHLKGGYKQIEWAPVVSDAPVYYNIYGSETDTVDTKDSKQLIAAAVRGTHYVYVPDYLWENKQHFVVTAIDAYGVESLPVKVVPE